MTFLRMSCSVPLFIYKNDSLESCDFFENIILYISKACLYLENKYCRAEEYPELADFSSRSVTLS